MYKNIRARIIIIIIENAYTCDRIAVVPHCLWRYYILRQTLTRTLLHFVTIITCTWITNNDSCLLIICMTYYNKFDIIVFCLHYIIYQTKFSRKVS